MFHYQIALPVIINNMKVDLRVKVNEPIVGQRFGSFSTIAKVRVIFNSDFAQTKIRYEDLCQRYKDKICEGAAEYFVSAVNAQKSSQDELTDISSVLAELGEMNIWQAKMARQYGQYPEFSIEVPFVLKPFKDYLAPVARRI